MKRRYLILAYYWASTLLWAGLIYYLSNQPGLRIVESDLDKILRKIAHAFFFAMQTILLYRAVLWTFRTKIKDLETRKDYDASILIEGLLLIAAGLVSVIYAAFDEYHQSWVETRHASVYDVVIDSTGILVAVLLNLKFGIIAEAEHRFARFSWNLLIGQNKNE